MSVVRIHHPRSTGTIMLYGTEGLLVRTLGVILLTVVIGSGCATRMPLASLPDVKSTVLRVEGKPDSIVRVTTESAAGHNARQHENNSGLVGIFVVNLIGSSTKGNSEAVLQELRRQTGSSEEAVLGQALQLQINKAGIPHSDQTGERTLTLQLDEVGLLEAQRGFWQVRARVTASIRDARQKDIWTVHVSSGNSKLRSLDEFSRQPQLYASDFREVAEDATRQLVFGPIREFP